MRPFRHRSVLTSFALLLTVATTSAASSDPDAPEVRWEPYVGETRAGKSLEGELGRIVVPENRAAGTDARIEIAFVRYRTENPDPGPPIVFLIGGPGAPGIEWCAEIADDPRMRLLDHADVIGIDQRGTGHSVPNLEDAPPFEYELPVDRPITREDAVQAWRDAAARCHAYWTEQGVDLAAYNSAESADDVDAVRAALGIEQIVPWGTSYGSHLALAYLRRHEEHVARAVVMKVEGPDQTWKLPSVAQRQLEHLGRMVAADPVLGAQMPDLVGTVRGLLEQLADEPVTVSMSRGGETYSVVLGPYDLQMIVASALPDAASLVNLPAAVHLMAQGTFVHMLGFALRNRFGQVASAMTLMMDCASGASPERLARIERERRDPANLLGDALASPFYKETCTGCGEPDLGDDYRGPLSVDAPVLFVSGSLDIRTPPDNVEAIRDGFRNHAHILVNGTGHDDRELESAEYRELVHAFLRGEEVQDTTIELPPVAFMPLREL